MVEIWYSILCMMLTGYLVLDGFDIGAGMLQPFVARSDAEKRDVIRVIGPLWSWNEVWLISFGGVLFAAFPTLLATSFAGFYLALFLLLWTLVLRGISLEVGGHLDDALWRAWWSACFVGSNVLLAVLIGAALGNIVRGVPLDVSGKFSLALFTDFGVRGRVGILDWYTVSVALFVLATLAAHGALRIVTKTTGAIHDRSARLARILWWVVPVLLAVITVETWIVRPQLFEGMAGSPVAWCGAAAVCGGLFAVLGGLSAGRMSRALIGSCAFLAGLMVAGAAGAFPVVLLSTLEPEHSLLAHEIAADERSLRVGLVWWPAGLLLAIGYALFIGRHFRGKLEPSEDSESPY